MRSKKERLDIILITGVFPSKIIQETSRKFIFDKLLTTEEMKKMLKEKLDEEGYRHYNPEVLDIHRGIREIHNFLAKNNGTATLFTIRPLLMHPRRLRELAL
jgi:hypothetical protein